MDLSRALGQLADIHQQIAKGEIYRGYRSLPIAASGLMGYFAAWMQVPGLGASDPIGFVVYWVTVATCAGLVGASEIIYNYVVHEDTTERRRTRRVIGQFVPSVAAGAAVGAGVVRFDPSAVPLLPGLWALCFGLGVFASRPYLPRATGWVALYYCSAGTALIWTAAPAAPISGWTVGGVFAVGQLFASAVLWWNLERL